MRSLCSTSPQLIPGLQVRAGDAGYALVSLLAVMTLITIFAMAAAPGILQQTQREREKEAIFRGEEVADAIREYYRGQTRNGRTGDAGLPNSMDDLLQGVAITGRTKNLQVLRPSAARDVLGSTGEWHLVRPRSAELGDFMQSLIVYAGNTIPPTTNRELQQAQQVLAPAPTVISGLTGTSATTDEDTLDTSSSGPFVGVASRSKRKSVITYYGIDHHDLWIFTPLFR
jgi:type II secretory pathway pseudopilin PulG